MVGQTAGGALAGGILLGIWGKERAIAYVHQPRTRNPSCFSKPCTQTAYLFLLQCSWGRLLVRPIAGQPWPNLPQRDLCLLCPPLPGLWRRPRSSPSSPVWPPDGSSARRHVSGAGDFCDERHHSWLCWGADEPGKVLWKWDCENGSVM